MHLTTYGAKTDLQGVIDKSTFIDEDFKTFPSKNYTEVHNNYS